jgi:hypothetical protein
MRYWRITGYEGYDTIFDKTIPYGSLTESQLKQLLKCLLAKASLSYEEIVGAYVKRKTKLAHSHLDVSRSGPYQEFYCGGDPMFVAMLVGEDGKRATYPPLPWEKAT